MNVTTEFHFSSIAERIGKTTPEKRAVQAMATALGSVEYAIANGDTNYEGHCFIDDAEQYASEGLDSLGKCTLNSISEKRINELVHEVALTFKYLEEYNDKKSTVTTAQTSAFIPSYVTSMSFEDFVGGMGMFASTCVGKIAIDRVAVRAESLYNDITFRTIVFEYRQAVLARDDRKDRLFRSMVTGDVVYTANDWDNDIYDSEAKAYGDVLYDMLVRLPEIAEKERDAIEKFCK